MSASPASEAAAGQAPAATGTAVAPVPEGKIYIRDSDGDDTLIISGDHPSELISADLGTGNDKIIRIQGDPEEFIKAQNPDYIGASGITLMAIVLIVATLLGFAIWRFTSARDRS